MRWRFEWETAQVLPGRTAVLELQGVPPEVAISPRIDALFDRALSVFERVAEPRAVVAGVTPEEFGALYRAADRDPAGAPLDRIAPRADALALHVATVGIGVTAAIDDLFASNDPALAAMLDGVASEAANRLTRVAGDSWVASLRECGVLTSDTRVLSYSPGYCGWRVTGQRPLFEVLMPGDIGVVLNDHCLMQPLKSVSGVLVAGPAKIHRFPPDYPFCEDCVGRECRARIASLLDS